MSIIVGDSTYSKDKHTRLNKKYDGNLFGDKNMQYESIHRDHTAEALEDIDVLIIEKDKLREDSV